MNRNSIVDGSFYFLKRIAGWHSHVASGTCRRGRTKSWGILRLPINLRRSNRLRMTCGVRADKLDAMTPSRQVDWTSHAHSLEILKEQVNQLGQTLTNLEELKPQANEGQRMAIENARPHLVGVAQQVTEAIDLLSDDRRSVYWPPYSDTVNSLYNHATSLHETVDTILDYEKARMRLLDLDLSTSAAKAADAATPHLGSIRVAKDSWSLH